MRRLRIALLGRSRGQALTELALITPLALLMILGGFDLSTMASDTGLSVTAARHGARLGAEEGGTNSSIATCDGTLPAATTLAAVDGPIVQTVLAAMKNMSFMGTSANRNLPDRIDIYKPSAADGKIVIGPTAAASDEGEYYLPSDSPPFSVKHNTLVSGSPVADYKLLDRCQGPLGSETDIGVRVIWTFVPPNGIPGPQITLTEYSVEKISLCSDNCN